MVKEMDSLNVRIFDASLLGQRTYGEGHSGQEPVNHGAEPYNLSFVFYACTRTQKHRLPVSVKSYAYNPFLLHV